MTPMIPEPDAFESTLRALQRRPLPAQWREEMLQAAAVAKVSPQPARTPRWLLAGWGLAWAATLVLYLGTPAEPPPAPSAALGAATPPARLLQQHSAEIEALLAAN